MFMHTEASKAENIQGMGVIVALSNEMGIVAACRVGLSPSGCLASAIQTLLLVAHHLSAGHSPASSRYLT